MTKLLALANLFAIFLVPAVAFALVLEAENYIDSHDEGGVSIYVTSCTAASGGLAVEGFDAVGDWIDLSVDLAEAGSFVDTLRSAGLLEAESDVRATYLSAGPNGSDLTSNYHTLGFGIG